MTYANRNVMLVATATVFERADLIEAQLNRFLNKYHSDLPVLNTEAVPYNLIGSADWSDATECPEHESEQVRELFREVFRLRKLGARMVNKFANENEFPDLYVRAVISWKHLFGRLKEKLFHYSYSADKFEA